ncbi:hypothetical protein HPO96_37320 [Kribbella sandramycini]|uniref:Uncharacterized protein n=1 Tax=Kribbella sandramycini TaxID=60450 RepID=A0A7Y4L7R0_9ACTN|nr:hypothetical protein [Kribbella sandramycini]MBB6570225.1 hypothetical protein [Kribbella sandramycini]NOL45922.1 hypothetical protein [Kribbella sandramycini]
MRLNELVRSLLPEGGTVVDRTASEHAWPPLMKVIDAKPATPADDLLTAVTVDADGLAELPTVLADAAPGEGLLVLLPWPAHQLPVGPVVQALVSTGMQAVEAHPLTDTAWGVAVVCRRVNDEIEEIHAYLDPQRSPGPLSGRALLRLVDEHIVEGLVWRTQELRQKDTKRTLDAAAAARDAMAAERDAMRQERDDAVAATAKAQEAADARYAELEQRLADATAHSRKLDERLRGILSSPSYKAASSAVRLARQPRRLLGKRDS